MKRALLLFLSLTLLFAAACASEKRTTETDGKETETTPLSATEEKTETAPSPESSSSTTESSATASVTSTTPSTTTPSTTTAKPTTTKKPVTTTKPPVTTTKKAKPSYTPTLSYTRLPEGASALYNNEAGGVTGSENLYRKMVSAYLNYETSVPFAANEDPHCVLNMLRFHFPLFFADTAMEVDFADYGNGTVKIRYRSDRSAHDKIVENFEKRVKTLLGGNLGSTDAEKALTLYLRFCEGLKYDNALANIELGWNYLYHENNPRYDEGYRALMEGDGVCSGFAIGYSFLLSQAGLDSYCVFADGKNDAHAWTAVKLSGNWYFADPTAGISQGGKVNPIHRFGLSTTEMMILGYPKDGFRYSNYPQSGSFLTVTDTRFRQLYERQAFAPTIDYNTHTVSFKDPYGSTKSLSLA